MDGYCTRRVVSWICHHLSRGRTKEQILDRASKRRPPFAACDIEACYKTACQACKNAELIQAAPMNMRICDIPGVVLPKKGDE